MVPDRLGVQVIIYSALFRDRRPGMTRPGSHQYGYYDIVSNMKTTIDIPDPLLGEARRAALRDGTTLRELVERGLRQVLQGRNSARQFKLRKASFRGKGLQEPLRGASWDKLRELAYEGRGT